MSVIQNKIYFSNYLLSDNVIIDANRSVSFANVLYNARHISTQTDMLKNDILNTFLFTDSDCTFTNDDYAESIFFLENKIVIYKYP